MTDKTIDWREEAISKAYDRKIFDCGDKNLNDFLQHYARQSHLKSSAKTYLAIDNSDNKILGFYSLSPATIEYSNVPETIINRLGKYDMPVFRLGRLAVDKAYQGKGLGGQLLAAAIRRTYLASQQVGGIGLLIDAKNEQVAKWYVSYGAVQLVERPLSLVIPFATVKNEFS